MISPPTDQTGGTCFSWHSSSMSSSLSLPKPYSFVYTTLWGEQDDMLFSITESNNVLDSRNLGWNRLRWGKPASWRELLLLGCMRCWRELLLLGCMRCYSGLGWWEVIPAWSLISKNIDYNCSCSVWVWLHVIITLTQCSSLTFPSPLPDC